MKRILIYYPFNKASSAILSQGKILKNLGLDVMLLTNTPHGAIHDDFEREGIPTFSAWSEKNTGGVGYFVQQIRALRLFCKTRQITHVFAHIQSAGAMAGLGLKGTSIPVYYFRHNLDYLDFAGTRKDRLLSWLAQRTATKLVAISEGVKERLVKEGVKRSRIVRINLSYDFSAFTGADPIKAAAIRTAYPCDLLLVKAARLDPFKRHEEAFKVVQQLLREGVSVKLICLGEGPAFAYLSDLIIQMNLQQHVFLLGFVNNVAEYYTAADLLIHMSVSEASCNVAKEAGMCRKTVIVCRDTGDFDDYITNEQNGFLVDKAAPCDETVEAIRKVCRHPELLKKMGEALYDTIGCNFSENAVKAEYLKLFK